jgi:hypothetical protein
LTPARRHDRVNTAKEIDTMHNRAAVAAMARAPLTIGNVELDDDLAETEILVRVVACAICHAVRRCLRQLSSGQAVSMEVSRTVDVGRAPLRRVPNRSLRPDGEAISGHMFQQSAFADHVVATEHNVVVVPDELPLEKFVLGCGIMTGAGGVLNALQPCLGDSIVIFGAGGVGASAIMAAAIIGCRHIIAVERPIGTARPSPTGVGPARRRTSRPTGHISAHGLHRHSRDRRCHGQGEVATDIRQPQQPNAALPTGSVMIEEENHGRHRT